MSGAYDVIIVGSGAGGGTLVRQLAPTGARILLLERGDWLPREPPNWRAQVHYFVGGATKLCGTYPFPPVSHEPRIQQLSDDLAAAGGRSRGPGGRRTTR